ncbi:MAG: hypothetical protein ACFFCW_36200 [Candidatus Hodarchaeota archaeon]
MIDDPFNAKLFNGASSEEKFEISVLALGQVARVLTLQALRIGDLLDRLEKVARRHETQNWLTAINERIEERKNGSP